jgi:hypothetical protein
MQTWHCIALIILSIGIYLYATYVKQVDHSTQISLNLLAEEISTEPSAEENPTSDDNQDSVWAEVEIMLQIASGNEDSLNFHVEIIDSKVLPQRLGEELEKSPLASSIIFAPFSKDSIRNDLLPNQLDILASLISLNPSSTNSVSIVCKGHSMQAAKILADAFMSVYKQIISKDHSENPAPPSLSLMYKELVEIEEQIKELKISLQEEMKNSPSESIENMAIRSEIMQLDEEIKQKRHFLIQIEKILSSQKNPMELLDIPPIRDFGKIAPTASILTQLKEMLSKTDLNDFTREEVIKNIEANSQSLEQQVLAAVESLKGETSSLLEDKKALQQTIYSNISNSELALAKSPKVLSLQNLKEIHAQKKREYEDDQLIWISSKSSYSLYLTAR